MSNRKLPPPREFTFLAEITEAGCESAVDYLEKTAPRVGAAYKEIELAEEHLKIARARAFRLSGEKTEKMKEADALCSDAYFEAVERYAEAKSVLYEHIAYRKAAELTIAAFQTKEATRRANRI